MREGFGKVLCKVCLFEFNLISCSILDCKLVCFFIKKTSFVLQIESGSFL